MVDSTLNGKKIERDELGRLVRGNPPLNPNGRPKGQTLKEFARQYLMSLSDEDKLEYLCKLPPEIVWRMSEGNPTEDRNVKLSVPVPILGGSSQAVTALESPTTTSSPPDGLDTPPNESVAQYALSDTSTPSVVEESSVDTTTSVLLAEEIHEA